MRIKHISKRLFENIRAGIYSGFTLSEIIVTLCVLGFIAALSVPMIGQQKFKKEANYVVKHGSFECFYDKDGVLHQFSSDNGDNKNGAEETPAEADACIFTVKDASYIAMQAVGAGGDGAVTDGTYTTPSWTDDTSTERGEIRTDFHYHEDLHNKEKVPDWVRDEWNKQWSSTGGSTTAGVKYEIKSGVGSTGSSICMPRVLKDGVYASGEACTSICLVDLERTCPKPCYTYNGAKGGNSANGLTYTVYAKLGVNDDVKFENLGSCGVQLSTGSGFARVDASAGGGNAGGTIDGTTWPGRDGVDANPATALRIGGSGITQGGNQVGVPYKQLGPAGCSGESAKPCIPGIVNNIQTTIKYEGIYPAVKAVWGPAGTVGETVKRILEKVPQSTQLKLVPAKNTSQPSIVYVKDKDGNWKKFIEAKSGLDGKMTEETIPLMDLEDLPFPKKYFPDSLKAGKSDFSLSTEGYKSLLGTTDGYHPGDSGAGAHPLGSSMKVPKHIINGTYTNDYGSADLFYEEGIPIDICLDGGEIKTSGAQFYCGEMNTKGTPGAIVLSW